MVIRQVSEQHHVPRTGPPGPACGGRCHRAAISVPAMLRQREHRCDPRHSGQRCSHGCPRHGARRPPTAAPWCPLRVPGGSAGLRCQGREDHPVASSAKSCRHCASSSKSSTRACRTVPGTPTGGVSRCRAYSRCAICSCTDAPVDADHVRANTSATSRGPTAPGRPGCSSASPPTATPVLFGAAR